uniref:Wsv360-like protein n=1 Tax=Hemigrapsus takanoi nimavirus TaxID=2133792 RepID=A0A401IP21_9VIRU|nr:MAG: wsv360-like protein [Hemigrapsus takanoi nimavirus]GBG35368.1 wsv360-like protein [Hemigrapsus takanoi nimavirus]
MEEKSSEPAPGVTSASGPPPPPPAATLVEIPLGVDPTPGIPPPPIPPTPASASIAAAQTLVTQQQQTATDKPSNYLPNIPLSDQLVDRCVSSAAWVHNIVNVCDGSRKQRRGFLTRYNHLETQVTHDVNNIVPGESIVFSKPSAEVSNLTDSMFVTTAKYAECSLVSRVFTPSIRSAGEIIDSLAYSQYNTYHIYSARKMTPAFLSNCASNPAFGSKKEKREALRKCFADGSRVDALIKDFEMLRDNAYAGFIRALEERSPVNVALAAWICGRATADHILLRKNRMKYSAINKYEIAGLFNNDGTSSAPTDPEDYIAEIGKRSKNHGLTFDTATRVFDTAIRRILGEFINKATDNGSKNKNEKELSVYLRQTRFGTRHSAVDDITNSFPCLGMLTPRNQEVIKSEIESMPNKINNAKTAHMLDEELNFVGKKRKRHTANDFDKTLANDIVAASSTGAAAAGDGGRTLGKQAEWSMHITQLVSQAFLEAMASLLASAFGVADPLSERGIKTIKDILVKSKGNKTTKRIEVAASTAAVEYFLKIGNFSIPFVASDPHDILEGRRVSPNTPIIFLVNKKTDPKTKEVSTVFSIRDRLLVEDNFMDKALKSTDVTAATYKDLSSPAVGGSLPVIRGPLSTAAGGSSVKEAKEGISLDWYVHLSNMCATGKTSAAVASGISRALSSVNAKKKSLKTLEPSEKELRTALRRNVDRSKNLLVSLGQNLSSWGYEEHSATVSSFWSSTAAVRANALQEALNRGNDTGVRHQMDTGCMRDSFARAEEQLRLAFFKAVDRPGDSVMHLSDILSSLTSSDGSPGASWKIFLEAMEKLPGAARKVFNVKELIKAIESFRFPVANNRNRKDVVKNISSVAKLIKGLVDMTLQTALNTSKLAEAGSVADGWSVPTQFEPSRMRALEDLAGSRHRNDVVSILLNRERGSISFGNSRHTTNVLVIPLVILEHLVADKVVLDSYCLTSKTNLSQELGHFIDILTGKDNKNFKDQNRFLTLVRYIWFNVAILSLTDSNIVSAIDMTQRNLGASIYQDYLAIMSLINTHGREMTKFSIGKLIEAYACRDGKNKTTDFCTDVNKISTDVELNSVLKRLITATSAFSGESEAKTNWIRAFTNEGEIRNIDVTLNINELIGSQGKTKIEDLMGFLLSIVNSSIKLRDIMKYASSDTSIPNPIPIVMSKLNVTGPALSKVLSESKTVEIDHNPELKMSVIEGYTRLIARLDNEPEKNSTIIGEIRNDISTINSDGSPSLISTYNIPAGITAKSATSMISALNERYPHLDILLVSIQEFISLFNPSTRGTVTVKLNDLKRLLKHGSVIALMCLSTTDGTDFNSGGVDVLAKALAHFSAEATLALSRAQRTFSPIHPGLLTLYDTFEPSRDNFDRLTEDFVKTVIEKIEEGASPILSRCDDAGVARGLAEAGKNYNNAANSSTNTSSVFEGHILNPTDVWNKYSLAYFDTAVVPKYVDHSNLSNVDILKMSAFWQGIAFLPESASPSKWDSSLAGNNQYGGNTIPGMSNVCTFNSALDTMLANPESSCGLITREITRNSARLAHDLSSGDTMKAIEDTLGKGTESVMKKTLTKPTEEEEGRESSSFDVFSTSTTSSSSTICSAIGLISERYKDHCPNTSSEDGGDLIFNAIRSIPKFRRNIIEATRSLFESAAICSLLSSDATAKVAGKKIINLIKDTSPVIDEIGINRISGLVSSITSPKQYRNFLTFVDEKRNYWMRKAAIQYNACGDGNDDSVYLGLASVSTSKTRNMPDRFWLSVFEDCDNYIDDEHGGSRLFTSKINSYAAVATDAYREDVVSLESEMKARRAQVKSKLADIEAFIVEAAKTDLFDDSNVALSNLLKSQRLYARMTAAAEIRNNDSALFSSSSNNVSIPCGVNVISGVFDEMTSDTKSAGSLVLVSKLMVAKELVKHSSTPESIQFILASTGVDTHAYKLAEIICQRMTRDDIGLFLGGTILQRGLFTTFLLNDILIRQISPELKTESVSDDTKTKLVNLVEFCSKIKRALFTMKNNKGRAVRRYNRAVSKKRPVTDDMRADWAFASSVFSAFNTLRNRNSNARTSTLVEVLSGETSSVTPLTTLSGAAIAPVRPKRNSNLHDVLTAGSTLNRSFLTNYCEKAAASKIVRTANIRLHKKLRARKYERPSLLACFDSGELLSEDVEGGIGRGRHHAANRYCQDEDYDMLIDEYEEERMDISSESSSSSSDESSTDYLYSSEEEDEDYDKDADKLRRDALDTLDTMAVPLGRLYACGDDYDDFEEENNVFDRNLGRMIGRVEGGVSDYSTDDENEDDEEYKSPYSKSIRRAERIVYGAGFLSGGSSKLIYSNSSQLGKFLRGKRAKYDDEDDYDDLFSGSTTNAESSASDGEGIMRGSRRKRRSRQDQLAFLKRGLHQFLPKDILIDDNDRITMVEYTSDKKLTEFYKMYSSANIKDRKELRDSHKVTDVTHLRESRIERVDFRRSLVKSAAVIIKTLKKNSGLIYSALFANSSGIPQSKLNAENIEDELLFSNKLKEIVDKRNAFIKDASASAPTLFSCEDSSSNKSSLVYNSAEKVDNGGYLHTPLVKMAACIKNSETRNQLTVPELLSVRDKNHLDWLTSVSVVFARHFNSSTGYALDEALKVTTVLKSLHDSFSKLFSSSVDSKINVKSTLFSDMFNTRMVHTGAILGLYYPTAFMNHQLTGKTEAETNEIETELLTLVRGVNSRQLNTSDLGGSTDVLLNRLMSKRVAGPSGMRGGLSLFRMSLTDTVLGKGDYRDGGRVKGAVSLEVPVEGDGGAIIENSVFSKKCKDLVNFCQKQNILLANASGPVYRFATGVKDIVSELGLNEIPSDDVADDPLANRLVCSETVANRGAFMRLSAHGNLFGYTDIITRLARKSIETYEAMNVMLSRDKTDIPTKDRLKKILDNIKTRKVKSTKTPFGRKTIIQHPGIPSFSDNVLLKSREFMASVTTLINDISKRLSLEFNKFSLKSFERILENSAILANTKTTLRNLENRLQAAVVELKQFKQIREEGLTVPRNVIANLSDKLCTLKPDSVTNWLKDDQFITFVVDSELFNLNEAKMNITRALKGVHVQHIALLEMINSAISSGTEEDEEAEESSSSLSISERQTKMMNVSPCGKYVIHPLTKMLVKIEDGDVDAAGGIESVHRQVALKILERIDKNRNSMLRSRLYAMRKGRGDLRDIVSLSNEDIENIDILIKYLSLALADAASAANNNNNNNAPSNNQQQQKSGVSGRQSRFGDSLLPFKKSISYIPVSSENKQNSSSTTTLPVRECTSVAGRGSEVSDSKTNDKTYRFLDQQEAHDLSSIVNILSKHKFGEYSQASIVSLFNRSHKYTNIEQSTESLSVPQSSVCGKTTTTPKKRMTEYVTKVASDLSNTAEYNELSDVYDDMKSALASSASLKTLSFFINPPKMGEQPKVDYATIKVVSEMKQLKSSAIKQYVKILSTLERYENDPSLASSSKTNTSPIAATIESGSIAINAASSSNTPTSTHHPNSSPSTSVFDKLESASSGGRNSIRDAMNREAAIRITLLMHYEPFLEKIQRILDMITQYFKNIDELNNTTIPDEAKQVSENQTEKIERHSEEYRQNLIPHFNRGVSTHKEEIKAIKTEIDTLDIKINEVDNIYKLYSQQLESLLGKLNTGTNESSITELMKITDASQQEMRTINDLKEFAIEHEGVVYQVPRPEPIHEYAKSDAYANVSEDIGAGQETVKVSFKDTMALFPKPIQEINSNDDIKLFTVNLRSALDALESYKAVLAERIRLLGERAVKSEVEANVIDAKIVSGESVLQNHVSEQKESLKRNMSIAVNTVETSLSTEVIQHELLTYIEVQVERVIANATRGDSPQTADETGSDNIINKASSANEKEKLVSEVAGESVFACQLEPLHDSIDRIMDMYRKKKTGTSSLISTGVDLQLSSIFDMSMAVLGKRPEQTASAIVPGLCKLCAMMITNLHEATHTSEHSFSFDKVRSAETLRRMLSAIISRESNKANVRYDTLSLLESHNGYIKDLKFKKKQTVACMTPVNTLPGAYGNMAMHPGTVLLPSSELFACDGLDHDKFRAIAHRCNDPALADSSKSADSIVETLATSSPNAEMLFYTCKDERRHFNSIPDCIIEHMSENANSVFNTQCSQSTVKEDSATGIPIFVGRLRGGVVLNKTTPNNNKGGNGGIPTHCGGAIDMSAKYMVAPGSTLNAKKEEMMRLSRLSDINNVKYGGLDVNVAGSNSAWRISEIVKAACGGNDMLMEKAKKMLLLGSVTSIVQQKASTRMNDPSTLLQTNSVVDQYISDIPMSSEDLVTKMAYQQRFFPQICNKTSEFVSAVAGNSNVVCPGDLLGDFKRYRKAMGMAHNNGCRVFLDNLASVPASSTPQGILDMVVQSQSPKKTSLAVEAMTDSTVDMVAAVSSGAWRGTNLLMPYSAITGKPVSKDRINSLRAALTGVIDNAAKLERSAAGGGLSSLNSILRTPSSALGNTGVVGGSNNNITGSTEAERIFKLILGDYAIASSNNTGIDVAKNKSLVSSVLDVSDLEMSEIVKNIEDSIERKRLEQAVNEIKRNVMISSSSPSILGARVTPALSSVLSGRDVRDGRLSGSIMESGEDAVRAVDIFKTAPLLVRHTALFHPHSPLSLSRQTKDMLARRTRCTTTANNILSESMPLLGDIVLCNTRDTPVERAIDRMLLSTFIVKQGKNFDDICSTLPVALTSVTHNMLSAIDTRASRLLSNLKLHVNDTTSIFKNAERFEKFVGRYGDEYAMSNRQNCNCPFELHHDFRPSVDESLVRSFAYARPEVTQQEIRDTPYQCNRMLSDKHYIMASTKVDARITGSALYRRVSEWADMHSCVSYTGAFEPSRIALSNSSFATTGVNLDVIVRPNNARGVLGILGCHRKHLCIADLKTSVASALPSVFSSSEELASELVQNALPHNKYIQKSRINAASIIFANVLDKTIKDLGVDISRDLASKLINGEFSVSEMVLEETSTIMNKLMDSASLINSSSNKKKEEGEKKDATEENKTGVTASAIATNYTKAVLKEAVSSEMLLGSAENVPFSTAVDGSIAFDFLMSKDQSSSSSSSSSPSSSSDKTMVAIVFEAIANRIGDKDFKRILDEIEAKITQHEFNDRVSSMSKEAQESWRLGQQDLRRLLSFMRILKDNIAPSLSTGELGEKMKLYISLISAKSRLENTLRYGLSNSSSVDLSHLKPLNPTAVSKNIEDTFTYRNVPPVFVMALPENFAALFQQEQRDPEYIIDNRRSLTSFLNHPNTSSMARSARASVGAGGGNALGIYPSSLLLQESTVSTTEPVVDAISNTSFETTVTKSPMMIVDPFKESAGLELPNSASDIIATASDSSSLIPCSYLQVSMPTQFSGLVTNTGVPVNNKNTDTFELKKRDGTVERYKKLVPSVLCSDASFNLLDEFSRADTTLNDMEIKFSFMPEVVSAVAKYKGMEVSDIIKKMSTNIVGGEVNRTTGDVIVKKSGIAFPSYAVEAAKVVPTSSSTNTWGGADGLLQGRLLPSFLIFNPTGAASVNGVPITREGELLAAMKREKAAGVGEGDAEEFGKGMLSEGALRAVGDKAISSELKPLKESWDRIVKLQAVLSRTASSIYKSINNENIKNPKSVNDIVTTMKGDYNTLNNIKSAIRDIAARHIASSDLITGGYGGDPTQALIAPYKSEQTGVIGAISAGIQMGIGSLIATNSRGIEELRTAMEEQITLSSKQGREMPEHGGIRYDTGEELITDADSLFRGLTNKTTSTPLLHRVVDTIVQGLENGDRLRRRALVDVAPASEHHTEKNKRRAITKLLSDNHNLLSAIANTMYFGAGSGIVDRHGNSGNNKVLDVLMDIKYQQQIMNENASRDGMNTLFSRK